jgi:hypothetical protein
MTRMMTTRTSSYVPSCEFEQRVDQRGSYAPRAALRQVYGSTGTLHQHGSINFVSCKCKAHRIPEIAEENLTTAPAEIFADDNSK